MTDTRLVRMPALDGLRAVAIVLVVAFHASPPQFRFGMLGVDVFFVLSGFLITAIIAKQIQDDRFSRRRFYARRAIRLVPALVVTVFVFLPIGVVMFGNIIWLTAAAALLYLTPFMPITIFGHTWTLAVEEWFYLIWPLVLAKLFRDRLTMRQVAALAGALAVAMQAAFIIAPGNILARPSALLAGCALALWWIDGGRVAHPTRMLAAGTSSFLVGALAGPLLWGPLPYWLAVGGSALAVGAIASGAGGWTLRVLELRPMVAVGVVSYEWYLLHAPMVMISGELWGAVSLFAAIPLSLLLAFGLHHALAPLQGRLRRRLDARLAHQTVAPVASTHAVPLLHTGLPSVVSK